MITQRSLWTALPENGAGGLGERRRPLSGELVDFYCSEAWHMQERQEPQGGLCSNAHQPSKELQPREACLDQVLGGDVNTSLQAKKQE